MLKSYLQFESMDKKKVPFDFEGWDFYSDSKVRRPLCSLPFDAPKVTSPSRPLVLRRRPLNSSTALTVASSPARSSSPSRGEEGSGSGRSGRRVSPGSPLHPFRLSSRFTLPALTSFPHSSRADMPYLRRRMMLEIYRFVARACLLSLFPPLPPFLVLTPLLASPLDLAG